MKVAIDRSVFIKNKYMNNVLSFGANKQDDDKLHIPEIRKNTPLDREPGVIKGISLDNRKWFAKEANKAEMNSDDYMSYLRTFIDKTKVEPSVTVDLGRVTATSLIDGQQIFNKTIKYLKSAKENILVEMFELQNVEIDGHIWGKNGADKVPGNKQQEKILQTILDKKRKNPNLKVQIILDCHKWYIDGNGDEMHHFANLDMIRHLKENDIDVVPYPREMQDGAKLQHVKYMSVDNKKCIIGGMNWGTHSVANHDSCVAIENKKNIKNSEIDNIIQDLFNNDWAYSWKQIGETRLANGPLNESEQEQITENGTPLYGGTRRFIQDADIQLMEKIGEFYENPQAKARYELGELDIEKVSPVDNPRIKLMINRPRQYSEINETGKEIVGDLYNKVKNAKHMRAELFALTHKEIINEIIDRHIDSQEGGEKFDCQIIVDPSIVDEFPFCQTAYHLLKEAGVPIKQYNVNKNINQRMHAKWAVFDKKDLFIGSVNWSAVGLESNLATGKRQDYKKTNAKVNEDINKYKNKITKLEKSLGLTSTFNDRGLLYAKLKDRRNQVQKIHNQIMKNLNVDNFEKLTPRQAKKVTFEKDEIVILKDREFLEVNLNKEKYTDKDAIRVYDVDIDLNTDVEKLEKLHAMYKVVKVIEDRKNKYKRGNHEVAIEIENKRLSETYLRQFGRDWKNSKEIITRGVQESINTGNNTYVPIPYADTFMSV